MDTVCDRYRQVMERIGRAARAAGRAPESVRLVAVSKTVAPEVIRALAPLAPVVLGENRVQEAVAKVPTLAAAGAFTWHLVGHLQGNKARRAAELFTMIHSVDGVALLHRLEACCREARRTLPVLLEVNLAGEEAKSGCRPEELPALVEAAGDLAHVQVEGLMAVPPFLDDPEAVRPYFRQLRRLRDEHAGRCRGAARLEELSMGMTNDFEAAIAEGATYVRVGTAIFGPRVG
jgi:hypothetical protein